MVSPNGDGHSPSTSNDKHDYPKSQASLNDDGSHGHRFAFVLIKEYPIA